jgi:hypothetical protein
MRSASVEIQYRVSPTVTNSDLNALFASAWPGHAVK